MTRSLTSVTSLSDLVKVSDGGTQTILYGDDDSILVSGGAGLTDADLIFA